MKITSIVAATAMVIASVSACSSGDDEAENADGTIDITVSVMPIVESAAVFVAQEHGLFEEEGLSVTISEGATSSEILPGVVSNQFDIGFSNHVAFLLAKAEGLPLTAITPAALPSQTDSDVFPLLVRDDSAATSIADLAGATIGVNGLDSPVTVAIHEAAREAGIDPDSIEFVRLGYSEQLSALERGDIDAAAVIEPFGTIGIGDGARPVAYPYKAVGNEVAISSFVMNSQKVKDDPEIADRFIAAINAAVELIKSDPSVLTDAVLEFSDIDPELVATMVVNGFPQAYTADTFDRWIELMVADDLLDSPDAVGDDLVYEPAS